jgi:hypothetical protein
MSDMEIILESKHKNKPHHHLHVPTKALSKALASLTAGALTKKGSGIDPKHYRMHIKHGPHEFIDVIPKDVQETSKALGNYILDKPHKLHHTSDAPVGHRLAAPVPLGKGIGSEARKILRKMHTRGSGMTRKHGGSAVTPAPSMGLGCHGGQAIPIALTIGSSLLGSKVIDKVKKKRGKGVASGTGVMTGTGVASGTGVFHGTGVASGTGVKDNIANRIVKRQTDRKSVV